MGTGGYLQIVNGTPYTFINTEPGNHGYQMNSWNPPTSVEPGQEETSYIEFKEAIGVKQATTQASVTYNIGDTGFSFTIRATDDPADLKARIDGFSTPTMAEGLWIDINFVQDGGCPFILSGTMGHMVSLFAQSDWMQQNLLTLGNQSLMTICLPGSHDAGMGELNPEGVVQTAASHTFGNIIQAQKSNIYDQLVFGSRYLDVRPVMCGENDFRSGHFSKVAGLALGCYGQSITDIISDINKFTQSNAELIIVDLSHGYDATNKFVDLSVAQWSVLFTQLTKNLKNLFTINEGYGINLLDRTLNSFIGNGTAAVIVCLDLDIEPELNWQGQGIFSRQNFPTYNNYSNTQDVTTMADGQIQELDNYKKDSTGPAIQQLHLVSWTLTPQSGASPSIPNLARLADKALYDRLFTAATLTAFPNVILIDWFHDSNATVLAMAINNNIFGNAITMNIPTPVQQRYVSDLTVQATNQSSFVPINPCLDISPARGSPDCNNGYSGEYTYVLKTYTNDVSEAITGLSISITSHKNPTLGDMADGSGGDYRYVIVDRDPNSSTKVSDVQLWRSKTTSVSLADANNAGWDGITTDINHGRSGAYMYLVWRNVTA